MRFSIPVPVLFTALMISVGGTALFGNLSSDMWSVVAALMGGCGFAVYITLLVRDRHPSSSASWLVWVVLDLMCAIGNWVDNEFNGLVLIYSGGAMVTCMVLLIRDGLPKWRQRTKPTGRIARILHSMLVLKDGISQWNNWDRVCTVLAIVGIFFWQVFNYMPLEISSLHIRGVDIGMFFAQLSGLIGSIPMWKHVWKEPGSESAHAWVIWAWSCIAGIMAISEWTFVKASSPVTFAFIEWVICSVMLYRRMINPPHQ